MAFSLAENWIWDFWLADDGDAFHMFYLKAPRALGDPELRHRNATIGHAISRDLTHWEPHGTALTPGPRGAFDETATWTGSVVRGPDGMWRMFYTGASFLSADSNANIEAIGLATSPDLFTWTRRPGPIVKADPRWYETLGTSSWPEEACRDPWVFDDPHGNGWHMLFTARANYGDDAGRGVVAHATSPDLDIWRTEAPVSEPQQGFSHIEVPQLVEIGGSTLLLFCCDTPRLANARRGQPGGIWTAPAAGPLGPFEIGKATLLTAMSHYAGRIARDRAGRWVLLAFHASGADGAFVGGISDPIPLTWDAAKGALRTTVAEPA